MYLFSWPTFLICLPEKTSLTNVFCNITYLIGGSNYVMLRDVGQVVGFNVYWNEEERTVQIESDRPYTGVAPEEQVIDDASIANPAIFTDAYTREAYNAIRQAIVTGRDSTPIPMSPETRDAMRSVITEIGDWTVYHLESDDNGNYHFTSIHPTAYEAAAKYCEEWLGHSNISTTANIYTHLDFNSKVS